MKYKVKGLGGGGGGGVNSWGSMKGMLLMHDLCQYKNSCEVFVKILFRNCYLT